MTLIIPEFKVDIKGKTYLAEVATAKSFTLEREDHGIFTSLIHFDLSTGGGQGFGTYTLDVWDESKKKRIGTAWGCQYIIECVERLGSPNPQINVPCVVFREKPFDLIRGFARLDGGRYQEPFIVTDLDWLDGNR